MSNHYKTHECEYPEELNKILKDFITDILNTFPEYHEFLTENELDFLNDTPNIEKRIKVFEYLKSVYPERFFDILYENEDIFEDCDKNTNFFENINFKLLWRENISNNTKKIIWKYLQLVLFSLSKNINGSESFGDTAKLFEAIDEDELKKKLEEVVSSMEGVFDQSGNGDHLHFKEMMEKMKEMKIPGMDISGMDFSNIPEMEKMFEDMGKTMDISGIFGDDFNFEDMMKNMEKTMDQSGNFNKDIPNPEDIHEHLNSLMDGKIGKLAQEIANETAGDLDIDPENINSVNDVFSKLFKNPGKLMGMIKKVSSKLDEKLKSGEINESELMKEASELLGKMKNTPGMKDMEKMLSKMGMGGLGGKGKPNINLFQSMMKSNMNKSKQKERMLNKLKQRRQEKEMMAAINEKINKRPEDFNQKTFNVGDGKMTKSKIGKKKKKKRKKNKNKNKK